MKRLNRMLKNPSKVNFIRTYASAIFSIGDFSC